MLRTLELAALPSTAQLCLLSADRCQGLVQTAPAGRYWPRRFHVRKSGAGYAPADVESLKELGLLARSGTFHNIVHVTDAGVELLNAGYAQVEVTA